MFKSLDAFMHRFRGYVMHSVCGRLGKKPCPLAQVVGKIVCHLELLADPPRMGLGPGEGSSKPLPQAEAALADVEKR